MSVKGSSLVYNLDDKGSHTVSSSDGKGSHTNVTNVVKNVEKNVEKNVYQLHVITSKEFMNRFPYESTTPINDSVPIWEEIKTPK
jgi:hypothetical protein